MQKAVDVPTPGSGVCDVEIPIYAMTRPRRLPVNKLATVYAKQQAITDWQRFQAAYAGSIDGSRAEPRARTTALPRSPAARARWTSGAG